MERFYLLVLLQLVHTRTHTHTPLSCTIFHASDFFTGKLPHTHTHSSFTRNSVRQNSYTHTQHCNISHRTLSQNLSPTMSHYISHLSHPIFTPLLYLLEEVDMWGYPILSFLLEHQFGRIMYVCSQMTILQGCFAPSKTASDRIVSDIYFMVHGFQEHASKSMYFFSDYRFFFPKHR